MVEIQDIFKQHGDSYRKAHKILLPHHKATNSIEKCRTSALGGHTDECDKCGYTRISLKPHSICAIFRGFVHYGLPKIWRSFCNFLHKRDKICLCVFLPPNLS